MTPNTLINEDCVNYVEKDFIPTWSNLSVFNLRLQKTGKFKLVLKNEASGFINYKYFIVVVNKELIKVDSLVTKISICSVSYLYQSNALKYSDNTKAFGHLGPRLIVISLIRAVIYWLSIDIIP